MYCNKCGKEISNDSKVCKFCGSAVSQQQTVNYNINMENTVRTKKKIYQQWWFWLIIVFLIIGIAGMGMSGESANTATGTNTAKEEKKEYGINEEARLGDGAITVTKVEKSQGNDWDKPKSGKEYVIVTVSIENKGNKNLSYNPFYFTMQNSQGQQEDQAFTTIDNDTSLQSGELIPGGKVSGTIAFEQPKGDKGIILVYKDNIWSSKELKINLQ